MYGRMIDLDATLGHHLFQISHTQPVGTYQRTHINMISSG
jgi:hypothetical protein